MHQPVNTDERQKIDHDWMVVSDGKKLVFMDLSMDMTDDAWIIADISDYKEIEA